MGSAFVRVLADLVDASLALAVALGMQFAMRIGALPPVWGWRPGAGALALDALTAVFALVLYVCRDVPTGASFAKWLLGLRIETRQGRPLPFRQRLLRAPFSLLPQLRATGLLPWRVVGYIPSHRGLVARAGLALGAAIWTIAWAWSSLRPSIGERDARRLAVAIVGTDPTLERHLGPPLEIDVRHIAPRGQGLLHGDAAEFEVRVTGALRRQNMRVLAQKIDGAWTVAEAVDIDITALAATGRDTMAAR